MNTTRDPASSSEAHGTATDAAFGAAARAATDASDTAVGGSVATAIATSTATTEAPPVAQHRSASLGAAAALLALIVLSVAWEWWLAPLRPGGTALVLKAVPLLLALPGVLRQRIYTLQWASMLILLYFAEGIVRGMSDRGLSARLGWLETLLALVFFVCALAYVAPFKRAARAARRTG